MLDGVAIDSPYGHAVRAIAASMLGDNVQPLADAEAVLVNGGSTYLDRVLANLGAAGAEVRSGAVVAAEHRLVRTQELADDTGDQVAIRLVAHACATLLPDVAPGEYRVPDGDLRVGWHRVITGLAGLDSHPSS
jgi:hypothetical protein